MGEVTLYCRGLGAREKKEEKEKERASEHQGAASAADIFKPHSIPEAYDLCCIAGPDGRCGKSHSISAFSRGTNVGCFFSHARAF